MSASRTYLRIAIGAGLPFGLVMAIFARAIEITSRSRVRFTLADYGKNAENVQRVAGWLAGPRPR